MTSYPWTAHWDEEPSRYRIVLGRCKRCEATMAERGTHDPFLVISPKGKAHIGDDYGMTACGLDATGDEWWWPQ